MLRAILRKLKQIVIPVKYKEVSDNQNVIVGRHVYGDYKVWDWGHWGDGSKVVIGSFCSIGQGVQIYLAGNHHMEWVTTYPFAAFKSQWTGAVHLEPSTIGKGNVNIGSDVWIGNNAVILSGVNIGHGAVIGANAVIAKDVPPYGIVAGNPAKLIKKRFDDNVISELLDIQWWNWEDNLINKYIDLLSQDKIDLFIEKARENKSPI